MAVTVFGITMVKDEADIIAETVGHMLTQVDHVIVADNGSTDGTREIVEGLGAEVTDDPDPAYYQSRKISALADVARRRGADWVVPFDADEIWYSPFGSIGDELSCRDESVVEGEVYDHVASKFDPPGPPVASIHYRRNHPVPLPKVACRTKPELVIGQGNHDASWGKGAIAGRLVVRHFPYRSVEQFIRKVRNGSAAYQATDLPETIGQHWRDYGRLTDRELRTVFRRYFWSDAPLTDPYLVRDPAPCQLSLSRGGAAAPTANAL